MSQTDFNFYQLATSDEQANYHVAEPQAEVDLDALLGQIDDVKLAEQIRQHIAWLLTQSASSAR